MGLLGLLAGDYQLPCGGLWALNGYLYDFGLDSLIWAGYKSEGVKNLLNTPSVNKGKGEAAKPL